MAEKGNGFDELGNKNADKQVSEREVTIVTHGRGNLLIILSKEAMRLMQEGYSFPLEMGKDDNKVRFVLIERDTYSKVAGKFTEGVLRDRITNIDVGRKLNEKVGEEPGKEGDKLGK